MQPKPFVQSLKNIFHSIIIRINHMFSTLNKAENRVGSLHDITNINYNLFY